MNASPPFESVAEFSAVRPSDGPENHLRVTATGRVRGTTAEAIAALFAALTGTRDTGPAVNPEDAAEVALGRHARGVLAQIAGEVFAGEADVSTLAGCSHVAAAAQEYTRKLRASIAGAEREAQSARSLLAAVGIAGDFPAESTPPDALPERVKGLREKLRAEREAADRFRACAVTLWSRLHPETAVLPNTTDEVFAAIDAKLSALLEREAEAVRERDAAVADAATSEEAAAESQGHANVLREKLDTLRRAVQALGVSPALTEALCAGHSVDPAAEALRAKYTPAETGTVPDELFAPLRALLPPEAREAASTPAALVSAIASALRSTRSALDTMTTTAKVSEAAAAMAEKRAGETAALVAPLRPLVADGDKLNPQSVVAAVVEERVKTGELVAELRAAVSAKAETRSDKVAELTSELTAVKARAAELQAEREAALRRAEDLTVTAQERGHKLDTLAAEIADRGEEARALVAPLRGFVKPRPDLDTLSPAAVVEAATERFVELAALIEEIRAVEPPGVDLAAVAAKDAPALDAVPFDTDGAEPEPYHGDDGAEDPPAPAVSPALAAWEASLADLTEGGSVVRLWRSRRSELQALGETDARAAWSMAVAKTDALELPEGWLNRAVRAADTAAAADAPPPAPPTPGPVQGALPGTVEEIDDGTLSLEALKAKRDGKTPPPRPEKAPSAPSKAAETLAPVPTPATAPMPPATDGDAPYDAPAFDAPAPGRASLEDVAPGPYAGIRFFKELVLAVAGDHPAATVEDLAAWFTRHAQEIPVVARMRAGSIPARTAEVCAAQGVGAR